MTDSAGSATALVSGVKTKSMLLGLKGKAIYGECKSQKGNEINSILHMAHKGKYQIFLKAQLHAG